jgi:uncharacterized membrane protein
VSWRGPSMYGMEGLCYEVRRCVTVTTTPPRLLTMWRLAVSLAVGVAAAVVTALMGNWRYALGVGWIATALVFDGWIWLATWHLSAGQTAAHATAEDPNRPISDVIMLGASVASLGALALVLVDAHNATGAARGLLALLAVLSVAMSWISVHTIFALRYASLYYGTPVGGIDFNQEEQPDYRDFAYLALTLGMTYQVSDTSLQNSKIRGTALRHALLSYLFGAIILAAAVNLIANLGVG